MKALIFISVVIFSLLGISLIVFAYLPEAAQMEIYSNPIIQDKSPEILKGIPFRSIYAGFYLIELSVLLLFNKKNALSIFKRLNNELRLILKTLQSDIKRSRLSLRLIFGLILIAGILLRLAKINQHLHYDEGFTYYHYIQKSFLVIISYYDYPNNHILHSLLSKFSCELFGYSIVGLRIPALISGILLVVLTFIYTSKTYGKITGLLAMSFVAFSPFFISYSCNARGYGLLAVLFILGLYAIEKIQKQNTSFGWVLFVSIQIIGFYTIPVMLYISIFLYLILLLSKLFFKNKSYSYKQLISSAFIVVIASLFLYMPVGVLMGPDFIISNRFISPKSIGLIISHISNNGASTYLNYFFKDTSIILKSVILLAVFIIFIQKKRFKLYFLSILILLIFTLIFQRVIPPIRTFSFLIILIYISASYGISLIIKYITTFKIKAYILYAFLGIIFSTNLFYYIKNESDYDYVPLQDGDAFSDEMKKILSASDRFYTQFPYEASVRSYFSFKGIPEEILKTDINQCDRIFILSDSSSSISLSLQKNELDSFYFKTHFKLQKTKSIENSIVLSSYKRVN